LLRFIDANGHEQEVAEIDGLYNLIRAGGIGYESLVRDDATGRWVKAADHPLFLRIREITGQQQASAPPAPVVTAPVRPTPVAPAPVVDKGKAKSRWFAAIATREEALKTISETGNGFFAVAAIQAVLGLVLINSNSNVGFDVLIDVPLYVGLAAWLKWGRSRTAAVLLLIVASIAGVTTVLGQLKIMAGGKNMIIAAIVLWAAIKAVEATFKLRGRFKDESVAVPVEPSMPMPPSRGPQRMPTAQ
jgi:hypothetical protein